MTVREIIIKCTECGYEMTKIISGSDVQYPEGMIKGKLLNLVNSCSKCGGNSLKVIRNKPKRK